MGASDLERFEAGYRRTVELLTRGEVAEAYAWIPDDFEWHVLAETVPQNAPEEQPVLHGRAETIEFFESLNEEWSYVPEPQSFELDPDGNVVVRVVGKLTGRATGLSGEFRFIQTWELGANGVPVRAHELLEGYSLDDLPG